METSEGFQFQFAMRSQVYLGHWSLDGNNEIVSIKLEQSTLVFKEYVWLSSVFCFIIS